MVIRNLIRSGFYLDSVALMRMSSELKHMSGVHEAVLMIGTEPNKQILREAQVLDENTAVDAGPSDLIIAVSANDVREPTPGFIGGTTSRLLRKTAAPVLVRQPLRIQPWIHWVMPFFR